MAPRQLTFNVMNSSQLALLKITSMKTGHQADLMSGLVWMPL